MENSYVSCIKIKGVPILPPLITPERRRELEEDRKCALILEMLYAKKKSENVTNLNDIETTSVRDHKTCTNETVLKEACTLSKYVPYDSVHKKVMNLSRDIIDISEYSVSVSTNCMHAGVAGGIEFECGRSRSFSCDDSDETKLQLSNITLVHEDKKDIVMINEENERPKLIRSNSYTLDNPSPLLLAHLKKQVLLPSSTDSTVLQDEEEQKSFKTESYNLSTHTIPHTMPSVEREDLSDNSWDNNSLNLSESNHQSGPLKTTVNPEVAECIQPTVEVINTDITVQQINITTSIADNIQEEDLLDILHDKRKYTPKDSSEIHFSKDPEIELKTILQEIPEVYATKILELIEKQKDEQHKRFQRYDNIKMGLLCSEDSFTHNLVNVATPNRILVSSAEHSIEPKNLSQNIDLMRSTEDISRNGSLSSRRSQRSRNSSTADSLSLPFDMQTSCSESSQDFSVKTIKLPDVGCATTTQDFSTIHGEINQLIRGVSNQEDGHNANVYRPVTTTVKNLQKFKEQHAASIICAYVKGYLVRRLMKTTKVQTLIQTIQDALLCALELQRSETIEEADVELHRRLIQQVSAACYEFHDIFFGLSIPEKMDLIAIDREKKKRALTIRAIRSSIGFQPKKRSVSNVRLSKSLTKV